MAAIIEMENICKTYRSGENAVEALRNVSLTVEEGEFLSIVGNSGSGKSTLMNILGCLDLPTSGTYRLDGADVFHREEQELSRIRNREIGFIFQGFHLIPTLTAFENVELPLVYRGIPRGERRQLCAEALRRMGLEKRAFHRPAQLSGGQQQRVAIARAIAACPPLILADEPTGNLDSATGRDVMNTLLSLNGEGKTIILITHDPSIAAMARRRVLIRDGQASILA
ncbi:MAG: ABC transporter ATP-binding protein [Candidatus Merdivicinus sp.]|jgi:putative ABC transport system ATP-binding protein